LFVMDADSDTYRNQLRNLDEDELTAITDVRSKGYAMLEKIDFRHPIFVDFASSKFNDFTKIRFWKHRRVDISNSSEWRILAGFDDGAPALLERSIGSGRLWLMTAGWQPTESQLALSSKFVPLMASLFGLASPPIQLNQALTVGDRIPVDEADKVLGPDGIERSLNEPASEGGYATQEPGFFLRRSLSGSESIFAVNLAESECQTEVGDLVKLERFGVTMSTQQSELRTEKNQRQLRSAELESQQSWWRWAVLGILGAAGIESILCVKRNNSK